MISTINRREPARGTRTGHETGLQHTSAVAFSSDLGWMAVAWREDALQGVVFGHPSRRPAELALVRVLPLHSQFSVFLDEDQFDGGPRWVRDVRDGLRQFAQGEPVDFADVPLALDHLTPFARRVVAACRRIPWGEVRTYGELAAASGSPGAARAAGSVMAKNRYPLVVPCHRVLAAGGALAGYSAPDGLRMKRRLLATEGAMSPTSAK